MQKRITLPKKNTFEFLSVKGLLSCLDIVEKIDIREWMLHDRLMQNDTKTEFIVLGSKQQLSKVIIPHITVAKINYPQKFNPDLSLFLNSTYDEVEFSVDTVQLLESKTLAEGAVYKTLNTFSFLEKKIKKEY